MEQVYKIGWSRDQYKLGHDDVVVCAWSSSNLFAFTTEKEVEGFTAQYINVLNPNQPWDVFRVPYNGGQITCLQWDHTGNRFITGDSNGLCFLWVMTASMSNIWSTKSNCSLDLQGEEVLTLNWLHSGVRVLFHIQKFDVSNLNEKFGHAKFLPSVMQYGRKHIDGYITVTGTGVVTVKLFNSDNDTTTGQVCLNVPCQQRLADIRCTNQGKIVVLTSDGNIQHYIQFHELELKYDAENGTLSIEVNALPSYPLKCTADELALYTHISHVKFLSRETQDHVLICITGPTGSKFKSCLLKKDVTPVHRVFQQQSSSVSAPEVRRAWKFVTQSKHLAKVMNFSVPAISVDTTYNESKLSQDIKFYCGLCVAVALADNTIQILDKLLLQPLTTQRLPDTLSSQNMSPNKRMKTSFPTCLQNVTFSPISCALIAVDDQASLLLYKVPPWLDTLGKASTPQARQQIVHLLLYCLVTGHEWWDVLLHIQPQIADNIVEQINLEMNKQSQSLQQILKSRFLAMKITIFHMSSNSAATDCHLKLLFDAVSLVFRSLVRPPQQVTAEENDPSVKLQMISRTSLETDISKLLQNVDTDPQVLLSMQQLIQWVADVTLYLLASVPYHKQVNRPGSSLVHDRSWLTLLREMLVLIRVWGLLKSACSPVFHALDSKLEILPLAFRLITLLWQTSSDNSQPKDIPASLINECCLLPSQVLIPPLEIIPAVNGVISHLRSAQGTMNLTFDRVQFDASVSSNNKEIMHFVGVPGASGKVDSLRRIYLGKRPNQELKECTRCGITTMFNNLPRSSLKVWDQRFVRSCICGGHWRKVGISNGSKG